MWALIVFVAFGVPTVLALRADPRRNLTDRLLGLFVVPR
jgi:hypothetical protein